MKQYTISFNLKKETDILAIVEAANISNLLGEYVYVKQGEDKIEIISPDGSLILREEKINA